MTQLKSLSMSYSFSCPEGSLESFADNLASSLGQLTSLEWPNEANFLWASCSPEAEGRGHVGALLTHADKLSSLQT